MPISQANTIAAPVTVLAKTARSVSARPAAGRGEVAVPDERAEGLGALRSRMHAPPEPGPAPTDHPRLASVDEPGLGWRPDAGTAASPSAAPTAPAAQPASRPGPTPAEVTAMLERMRGLIAVGDIAAVRRLAEYAAASGDGRALFALAETFDPGQLARWRVRGIRADVEKARALYGEALARGVAEAGERAARLP